MRAEPGDVVGAELRLSLVAAGTVLGFPVLVTDDDEWSIVDGTLSVGLGWYGRRGHSDAEAVALALLQLWEGPRGEREFTARARRKRSFAAHRPEVTPLLDAVLRLQSAAELRAAMPGLRAPLAAAVHRSVPADVTHLPRHLQWVAAVLWSGIEASAGTRGDAGSSLTIAVAAEVSAEFAMLTQRAGPGLNPVPRVIAPDPTRPALLRFERALALLLPGYERLLALDLRERGLAVPEGESGSRGPEDGTGDDADPGAEASGTEGAGGAEPGTDPESAAEDPALESAGEQERTRPGEGREHAEGADLFAAEQAGFVDTILATPMPAEGALFEAAIALDPEARASDPTGEQDLATLGGAPGTGAGQTALHDYRSRAGSLRSEIDRVREIWASVISERIAVRPRLSRRPSAEGEVLDTESFTQTVAAVLAGVARPNAYRARVQRPSRARRAGSTDYVFLIDRSASMQGRLADAAADAMLVMLEALAGVERDIDHAERAAGVSIELDIRTALLVFDAETVVVKPLSGGLDDGVRRQLHSAIRSPRGSTNDGAALRAAGEQLGVRPRGRSDATLSMQSGGIERKRIVFLISDGGSNDPVAAAREIRALRAAGVRVVGIGFGGEDIPMRYAPDGRRLDDPAGLAPLLREVLASELA